MKNEKDWWHKLIFAFLRSTSMLVVMAAFFYAVVAVNDNYIMHNVIIHENRAIAASTYLVLGGWLITTGIAISNYVVAWVSRLLKRNPEGKHIGFSVGTLKMQKYAVSTGIFAALNMICLLLAYQIMDPSLALALTTSAIVYLVIYDIPKPDWLVGLFKKNPYQNNNKLSNERGPSMLHTIISIILIVVGALLACVTKVTGEINFLGILLVIIGANIFFALDNIMRYKVGSIQHESDQRFDDKTFVFWRAFWLSLSGTFLISIIAIKQGYFEELWKFITNTWLILLPFAMATVVGNYIFQILFQKALTLGTEKVSKITMLFMLQIVFGIIVSGIVYLIVPTAFGEDFPTSPLVWVARIVGMSFIIVGVFITGKSRLGIRILVEDPKKLKLEPNTS